MGKFSRLGNELYEGHRSVDFVGRKWTWYLISGVILVAATVALLVRPLNFGIEFEGGVEYSVTVADNKLNQDTADELRAAVADAGIDEASSPIVSVGQQAIRIQTETMSNADADAIRDVIVETAGIPADRATQDVSSQEVGASWGEEVANRAIQGLIVFLVLVVLFIWAYFREWKMSVAALVALFHDIVITVGVYAASGFEVTPATVTGLLTILGFSLYDTVVVFDKVRENTKNLRSGRRTYAEQANLAVNQTLVRSINTSIVALLPVGALLYVGAFVLGAGSLKDLALSLFVGMAAGLYSSVFIATPLLVHLKQGEKAIGESDRRAKARARRDVDRYANVPSFSEGMAVADEPGNLATVVVDDDQDEDEDQSPSRPFRAPQTRPEASGSGRVVPDPKAPVQQSGSAHRPQPSRQPRSKRSR